jgi:hypothetical protein
MKEGPRGTVTALLQAWHSGEEGALDKLLPLVYGELRRQANRAQFFGLAAQMMRRVLVDRARLRAAAKPGLERARRHRRAQGSPRRAALLRRPHLMAGAASATDRLVVSSVGARRPLA